MKKFAVLFTLLAMASFCVACGGGDDDGTPPADAGNSMITLDNTVTITDWVTTQPLEGVTLCLDIEGVDCADTDADGTASFTGDGAGGTAVQMTGATEEYFPFLVEFTTVDIIGTATASYFMAKEDIVATVTAALGEEADPAKGHVGVAAWGPVDDEGNRVPLAGASVELVTGTAQFGPKYYNMFADVPTSGIFAEDGTETTDAGLTGFFNIDTGMVSVTVTAPGHDCTTIFNGLPVDGAALQTTVAAGRVTYAAVFCDATE